MKFSKDLLMNELHVFHLDNLPEDQKKVWQETAGAFDAAVDFLNTGESDQLPNELGSVEYLIVNKTQLTRDMLDAAPNLKFVQIEGRLSHTLPIQALKQRGIAVAAAALPSTIAVAEHAVALTLACAKKIIPAHRMTMDGDYRTLGIAPKVTTERSHGFQWMKIDGLVELDGLTLGIFGYGEIGNEIAIRMKAFNMKVLYHKRSRFSPGYEQDLGITYADKRQLFAESDVVILNCPLTAVTEKSVGARELSLMKSSAILVNVSRGGVIDEPALVKALEEKRIACAGLDVFVEEPVPHDHPYLFLKNIVLTPHIAGGKGNGRVRNIQRVLENIILFHQSGRAQNQIIGNN